MREIAFCFPLVHHIPGWTGEFRASLVSVGGMASVKSLVPGCRAIEVHAAVPV